ncbi:unnamed protein product [Fusarium graminearum]|uniref:Uncharacterized protein n=1 Tax=Gibberella zeae TaxID=5518 RepID=A0A4E9EJ81_GIBZA|nr:unnamed protein product [Fusarium graminearum]CAF3603486.1 unnamed protein product [Fusarium graminearum]CAG1969356.1 unnamed protein product [Fusarium graminearum]CAG1970682.1 unnamed protein product [Fusarium graminearum]
MSSSAQPHDCNIISITTKRPDILLHPLKCNIHILQSKIQKSFFGGQLSVQAAEYTDTVLHADSNIRLFGERKHSM